MRARYLLSLITLTFVIALTGCATSSGDTSNISADLPPVESLPAGATFAGSWYSNHFLHMYLVQNGSQVTGIYTYKTGGVISGTVQGNLLTFTWEEPGDKSEARRTLRGHAYLQLKNVNGTMKLIGKWGYGDSYDDGGKWDASYIRELNDEDPKSLNEWRQSGMEP